MITQQQTDVATGIEDIRKFTMFLTIVGAIFVAHLIMLDAVAIYFMFQLSDALNHINST